MRTVTFMAGGRGQSGEPSVSRGLPCIQMGAQGRLGPDDADFCPQDFPIRPVSTVTPYAAFIGRSISTHFSSPSESWGLLITGPPSLTCAVHTCVQALLGLARVFLCV